jgi:hypothetical protein
LIDGVFDAGTESDFYGPIRWVNTVPTGFGDNMAGDVHRRRLRRPRERRHRHRDLHPEERPGQPELVPPGGLGDLGRPLFMSNQIIGSLPIDTNNIGGAPTSRTRPPTRASVHRVRHDPDRDDHRRRHRGRGLQGAVFVQGNFTGFGDSQDATDIGGGGSEIDRVLVAQDNDNIYIFVAGNLEANGNGLDLHIDVDGSAQRRRPSARARARRLHHRRNPGVTFDSSVEPDRTFRPDYVISVDAFDDDEDGDDPERAPRLLRRLQRQDAQVDLLGNLAGYGAANAGALTGGDAGVPECAARGRQQQRRRRDRQPVAGHPRLARRQLGVRLGAQQRPRPDRDRARSARTSSTSSSARNMEVNFNKLNLFFDAQPGGQHTVGFDADGDPSSPTSTSPSAPCRPWRA